MGAVPNTERPRLLCKKSLLFMTYNYSAFA